MYKNHLTIWNKKSFQELEKGKINPAEIEDLSIQKASNFPVDFSLFTNLKVLSISSKEEYFLPNSLGSLKNLKGLGIGKNCHLPESISQLKNLERLSIDNQVVANPPATLHEVGIKHLNIHFFGDVEPIPMPEIIFEMKNLQSMRISTARFSEISEKINQLEDLTELDFGCSLSDLSVFPNLSGLKKLQTLKARGESVQGQKKPDYSLFPEVLNAIQSLSSLEKLDLCMWKPRKKADYLAFDENKRGTLSDIFGNFPNLKELWLVDMKLEALPESIFSLENLKILYIRENLFTKEYVDEIIKRLPNTYIETDFVYYKPQK